jgi:phage-related protein
MAEGFKIADAYVEVDAKLDERSVSRTAKRAGNRAGKDFGEGAGESAGRTMGGVLSGHLPTIFANPYALAAIGVAGAAIAPALGAAIAGGLIGASGVGVIAAGIALVADDPRIVKAGTRIKDKLMGQLEAAAQPFVGPLLRSLGMFDKALDRIMPKISGMMDRLAKSGAIESLAAGIISLVENALPGFIALVDASGPFLKAIGPGLGELGKGLGEFGKVIARVGPEATVFFTDLFNFLRGQVVLWAHVIAFLARAYTAMRRFFTAIPPAISAASAWFGKWIGVWQQLPSRIYSAIVGTIARIGAVMQTSRNTAVARAGALVSGVAAILRGLPGRAASAVAGVVSAIAGRLNSAVGSARAAGANIIRGLIQGISSMISAAASAAAAAVGRVVGAAKRAAGIGSPSKVMAREVGRWLLPGVTTGMASTVPAAQRAVAGMTASLVPGAGAPADRAHVGAGTSAGAVSYYFAPGSIVIDASSLRSMGELLAMIEGLKRSARAMRPRVAQVGV